MTCRLGDRSLSVLVLQEPHVTDTRTVRAGTITEAVDVTVWTLGGTPECPPLPLSVEAVTAAPYVGSRGNGPSTTGPTHDGCAVSLSAIGAAGVSFGAPSAAHGGEISSGS